MKKEISPSQKELVLKEVLDYIDKYNVTCGDDVIHVDKPSVESRYTMAEIVDIVLNTKCNIK